MASKILAGLQLAAMHYWPEAAGARSYLGHPHRHDFRISVEAEVTHDNRQIEFHDLGDLLDLAVQSIWQPTTGIGSKMPSFGARSCEQIGRELLLHMPQIDKAEVFEDGFFGAVVTRPTEMDDGALTYLLPRDSVVGHRIITICGSTRFKDVTELTARQLASEGWIVEMVEFFAHAEGIELNDEIKRRLDDIHRAKIRASHAVFVVNPGGYIGESTRNEIALARELELPILWLETAHA